MEKAYNFIYNSEIDEDFIGLCTYKSEIPEVLAKAVGENTVIAFTFFLEPMVFTIMTKRLQLFLQKHFDTIKSVAGVHLMFNCQIVELPADKAFPPYTDNSFSSCGYFFSDRKMIRYCKKMIKFYKHPTFQYIYNNILDKIDSAMAKGRKSIRAEDRKDNYLK